MINIERQKWSDLLEVVNQLEIKGQMNIYLMYKIIGFINGEIAEIDKTNEQKSNLQKQEGG